MSEAKIPDDLKDFYEWALLEHPIQASGIISLIERIASLTAERGAGAKLCANLTDRVNDLEDDSDQYKARCERMEKEYTRPGFRIAWIKIEPEIRKPFRIEDEIEENHG